uniref:Uncharacterized protein n=1 Tax=Aegilops tauschii subsp. strangulata TaxID=200361 RepID=A0A453T9W6_AEGTS
MDTSLWVYIFFIYRSTNPRGRWSFPWAATCMYLCLQAPKFPPPPFFRP